MPGADIASAFNGNNAPFIADLYARWAADPGSVDPSFAELFAGLADEARSVLTDAAGASWAPRAYSLAEAPGRGTDRRAAAPGLPADAVRAAYATALGRAPTDAEAADAVRFIDEQAAQCGYCIAGMLMRAQALLDANPAPSDSEIRRHMAPNLCRCGTHMRILRAVRRAAERMKSA